MVDSVGVYLARLAELPFALPPKFREYGPLGDDPDRSDLTFDVHAGQGLTFGIEYCDSHSWVSMRTIRCEGASGERPGYLKAFCHVRQTIRTFRLDRIISITHLRTGRVLDGCGHQHVLDAVLGRTPRDGTDAEPIGATERDGAALLLALAGPDAGAAERSVIADYIAAERAAIGRAVPAPQAIALWVDHFIPTRHFVLDAGARISGNRDALVRLLPWTLKVASAGGPIEPGKDAALRDFMDAVRRRFADTSPRPTPPVFARR